LPSGQLKANQTPITEVQAGLVPTPWRSGSVDREHGISKAGNRRLRHIMIELPWLWVRHQPDKCAVPLVP
jgi:transposase